MSLNVKKYAASVDMGAVLCNRLEQVVAISETVTGHSFETIFVEDFVTEDKERKYGSLFLFTSGARMVEARAWQTDQDIDCVSLAGQIGVYRVMFQNFDLDSATRESRMHVKARSRPFPGLDLCDIRAYGENCNALLGVLNAYILPNLK